MKFKNTAISQGVNVLANDHYVAIPYDCSDIKATDGVIPAGTIIPANDKTAVGVLLNDVVLAENPNGTMIIHGFIEKDKLPVEPAAVAITALSQIMFMPITVEATDSTDTVEEETE